MAKTLRRYLPGLLAYQLYRITNVISVGFRPRQVTERTIRKFLMSSLGMRHS